jgi:ribosomal protein S27AE
MTGDTTASLGDTHMKDCFKCYCAKPLSEFYAHKQMADGHLNKCKECTKKDVSANRSANLERYLAYSRTVAMLPHRVKARKAYAKTPAGRAAKLEWQKRSRQLNAIKHAARAAVAYAIKKGVLTRQECEACGASKAEAHHDDYSKPLAVRWLCTTHHTAHHRLTRQEW